MPVVDRGTHRIHYEVAGRDGAPPLLLVMGLGFSCRAWHTLPGLLAEDFRVVCFDNRGTGRSTLARALYRVRDMADDAAAVLDAAGIARADVFGISMGGMIAQELALRHPERVRALALGATFAGHLRSHKPSPRIALELAALVMRGERGPIARVARLLVSPEYFAADAAGFTRWLREVERAAPGVALRQLAAIALHGADARLRGLRVPTLVITGDRDRLVPPANSAKLAALIPGARLVILPGAGHVFPVERPRETVEALRAFFLGARQGRLDANGAADQPADAASASASSRVGA